MTTMPTSPSSRAASPVQDPAAAEMQELQRAQSHRSVYVYEVPVRLWHWTNALAICVLALTGYLIGSPLPSNSGEASAHYVMGYIRFAHFSAGYILAIGLLGRTYWAVVGNIYAKELFWVPIFQLEYWKDAWAMVKWYSLLSPRPGQYIGHNPLARLAMFGMYLSTTVFMILTGFALYSEGQQVGSWYEGLFGWVIPLLGQSQDVHTAHHLGMWNLIIFITVHIYAAVREEILGRSSMVSTMLSGYRTFKD